MCISDVGLNIVLAFVVLVVGLFAGCLSDASKLRLPGR